MSGSYLDNAKTENNAFNNNSNIGNILNNLLCSGLSVFMSFSLLKASFGPLGLTFDAPSLFIIAAMLSFCWFAIFFSKYTLKVTSISAIIVLFIAAAVSLPGGNLKKFSNSIVAFLKWCHDYVSGYENLSRQNEIIFAILLCVVVTLIVFLLTVKKPSFIVFLVAGSGLFGFLWINKRPFSFPAFYIYVATLIIYYIKSVYSVNKRRKTNEFASPVFFTLWILPFCGLVFLLSYAIPASPNPIQWEWLDKKVNDFLETYNYTSYTYFSLASVGFGDSSTRLGGPVTCDDMLVLRVEAPRLVYLKGAVRDNYNGSMWTNTDKKALSFNEHGNSAYLDMLELKSGMRLLTNESDYIDKYFYKDNIKISFASLKTKSLFYPLKTEKITVLSNNSLKPYVNSDSGMFDKKKHSKNFKYSLDVYNIRVNNAGLHDILRKSRVGLYEKTTSIPAGVNSADIDALYKNAQNMYKKYLQLPDNLPADVKKLAETITAGASNNYDKVKAIEQYLSANYNYTLSPSPSDPRLDFTYDFLFNKKEGYCTHYATAMTVLVRCLGIPARYVEGYILPEKSSNQNYYEVTNQQAHAWVEVYFEGFGWMPFEPTSPFTEVFYSNSDPVPASEQAAQSKKSTSVAPSDAQASKAYKPPVSENKTQEYNFNRPENLPKPAEKDNSLIRLLLNILALLSPFVLLATIVCINAWRNKKRIQYAMQLPPRESVLVLYKYYLKMFSLLGLPIKKHETPYQYYDRICTDNNLVNLNIRDITDIFVKARYSVNETGYVDKKRFHQFYDSLMQVLKEKLGLFRFYIFKYLLGII